MSCLSDRALAEQFAPVARSIARREVAKHGISYDDVYSDALYGLAVAIHRRLPGKPFAAYARSCMEGSVLHGKRDRAGRYRKAPRPELVDLDDCIVSEPGPGPYEQVSGRELWRRVDQLDTRSRLLVRLYYQWDFSQDELAPLIGVSQMQVSRLLRQARESLAVAIAG